MSDAGSSDDRHEAQAPTVVLDVHGGLDVSTAAGPCHDINAAASTRRTRIVVDLADVSAGDANACALMGTRARGHRAAERPGHRR
jgi:anti-anti-sigma regulatory factor